jgi:hypothetical protein
MTSKTYFAGSGPSAPTPRRAIPRRVQHRFDPSGLPTWIPDDPSLPESLRGLWYRAEQTFGIEFELAREDGQVLKPEDPEWRRVAAALLDAIRGATSACAPAPLVEYAGAESGVRKDSSVWNVEYDSSVGWEVTSPILADAIGYREVHDVCEALQRRAAALGLSLSSRTGTHIHLGWDSNLECLKRAVRLVSLAEPALATLVAPSRLVLFKDGAYRFNEPNPYCGPLSSRVSERAVARWQTMADVQHTVSENNDRYVTFNLRSFFTLRTVEVRMHSGTIEARKVLLWVSLWQQLLWAASVDRPVPAMTHREVIEPSGDIVAFARTWLPSSKDAAQQALLRRLAARREEIVELWRQHPQLKAKGWHRYAATWEQA